jgi:hypothetical protein
MEYVFLIVHCVNIDNYALPLIQEDLVDLEVQGDLLDLQDQPDQVVQVDLAVHYFPLLPQDPHCLEFLVGQASLGILLVRENHVDPVTSIARFSITPRRRREDNIKMILESKRLRECGLD